MRALVLLRTLITTKLGACAFCIRVSLLSSLSSWAVFAALALLVPPAAKLALLPALGFTTLFASHLVAYAVRVVLAYRKAGRVAPGETTASTANRRRFLVLSARTIALALVPTVLASALGGSVSGGGDCPRPGNCSDYCCCQGCKTRLKKCDPYYNSCLANCASRGSCLGTVP